MPESGQEICESHWRIMIGHLSKAARGCRKADMKRPIPDKLQHQLVTGEFRSAESYALEYRKDLSISRFLQVRLRRVSELLEGFNEGRILDIGCGPGRIADALRNNRAEYFGMDISPEMIEVCRRSFGRESRFRFLIGEMERLGFARESFDAVLCLGVLEYILDVPAALREVTRVLKPDGFLIATMLNERSPYLMWQNHGYSRILNGLKRLGRLFGGMGNIRAEGSAPVPKKPQMVYQSEKALRRLLVSSGLEIQDVLYYGFNVIPSPLDDWIPLLPGLLSERLEVLRRSSLRFLGNGFLVMCRKNDIGRGGPGRSRER